MRGRGLKFAQSIQQTAGNAVAPHAGAWIEIMEGDSEMEVSIGRSPCGGVD